MAFCRPQSKEARQRGWDSVDVVLFTGDAYIDHPAFGAAVIGRLLEAESYRVAVVPQPNWRDDLRDFRKFGTPRLFFAVTAGAMDSMVNHYTANKRLRSNDAYTPGGAAGFRPDYAVETYTRILKRLYPRTPVVVGGIEASLRRLTHYDYWQDALKPSILVDSGADLLIYGMGERVVQQVAAAMRNGYNAKLLRKLRQVAFLADRTYVDRLEDRLLLHSYEECTADPHAFAENFRRIETESNLMEPHSVLVEPTGDRYVVVNPANATLSTEELVVRLPPTGATSALPRQRASLRGEIGQTFSQHPPRLLRRLHAATISAHQGKFIHSRSERSILDEVRRIAAMPDFRATSPTSAPLGQHVPAWAAATARSAPAAGALVSAPRICPNLDNDHRPLLDLYAKIRAVKGIKKGLHRQRHRYGEERLLGDGRPPSTTSGRLKKSLPSTPKAGLLALMHKPPFAHFRAAQRRLPLDLPQLLGSTTRRSPTSSRRTGLHRTRHAGAGRQGAGPAAFHARTGAGPGPTPMTLVVDVLRARIPIRAKKGLRGTLAGGETPSRRGISSGRVRRTTAAGTADDSPEKSAATPTRGNATSRSAPPRGKRAARDKIPIPQLLPGNRFGPSPDGGGRKRMHRRIPTATIVPSQPDQIGRCRSTVSRRCSLFEVRV